MLCKLTSCWLCCAHACSLAPRTSRPPVWKTTLKNITGKLDLTCCYWRTVFTLLRFSTSGHMADCVLLLPFFLLSKKSVVLHEIVPRKSFSPVPLWWLLLNQKQSSNMWQMCIYSCENGQQWCLCLVNKYTVTSQNHPSIHQLYPGCLIVRAGLHIDPVVRLLQATHTERQVTKLMALLFLAESRVSGQDHSLLEWELIRFYQY